MYTEIDITKVKQIINELRRCQETLTCQYYDLGDVISSLKRIEEEGIQITCQKLAIQKSNLYSMIRMVQTLRITLEKIITLYQKCENEIVEFEIIQNMRLDWNFIKILPINNNIFINLLKTANIIFE